MGQRVKDATGNVYLITKVKFKQLSTGIDVYLNDTNIEKSEFHLSYGSLDAFYGDFEVVDSAL